MSKFYTVETKNNFALLSDDDESGNERILAKPADIDLKEKESSEKKRQQRPKSKRNNEAAEGDSETVTSPTRRGGRQEGGRGGRGGNRQGGRRDPPTPQSAANETGEAAAGPQTASGDEAQKDDRRSSRPINRPRRGGRGYLAPKQGRELDRHSGTGRGKEVSKGGAGAHNWGDDANEFKNEEWGAEQAIVSPDQGEVTEEAPSPVEPIAEEPQQQRMDYNAYMMMETKGTIPSRKLAVTNNCVSAKEFEEEGLELLKPVEEDNAMYSQEDKNRESSSRVQKAINLYQLAQETGVDVPMFSSARRGGRSRGRGRGFDSRGPPPQTPQSTMNAGTDSRTPDFQDNESFPAL